MTLHTLAVGNLIADPVARTGTGGKRFATASMRVATDDEAIIVSLVGFGERTSDLLAYRHGSTIAVSGRAKLSAWTGRDGAEHHGISIVVEQIASASTARRADADRRASRSAAA